MSTTTLLSDDQLLKIRSGWGCRQWLTRSLPIAKASVCAAMLAVVIAPSAFGQHSAPNTKGAKGAKAQPGMMPQGGRPGNPFPGSGGPGSGMGNRPFTPSGPAVPKVVPGSDRDNRDFVPPDPEKLPPDFRPPVKSLELTRLDKPLATQKELDELKREMGKYRTLITNGEMPSDADKNLIRRGIRYRLALLTDPQNREKLHSFREELTVRDMQFAARNKTRPDDIRAFRTMFCEEIVKQAVPLLDNNFYVRLQIAMLLGELDVLPNDPRGGTQLQSYALAAKPLVELLKDPNQPEAIKTAATNSLHRILKTSQPDSNLKNEIAQVLVDQLIPLDSHFWYQMRLIHAISANDTVYDRVDRKPFLWLTLLDVLKDPKRHWLVRGEAARALGRITYEPSVPAATIMQALAGFGVDLSNALQQNTADESTLRSAMVKLYLAFQPLDDADRDALRRNAGGLLSHSTLGPQAKPVYDQLLPIVRATIKKQPIPAESLKNLQAMRGEEKAPGTATGTATNAAANAQPQTTSQN